MVLSFLLKQLVQPLLREHRAAARRLSCRLAVPRPSHSAVELRVERAAEVVTAGQCALEGTGVRPQVEVLRHLAAHEHVSVRRDEDQTAQDALLHKRLLEIWRHHVLDLLRQPHVRSRATLTRERQSRGLTEVCAHFLSGRSPSCH